ncbi:hypothetical protein Kyoto67A_08940 [Helicobacter pylori]
MKSLKLERVLMPIGVFLKNMPEHSGKLGMNFQQKADLSTQLTSNWLETQ